jgi:hypothetical protein
MSIGENVRFVAGFVAIAALVFTVTGKDSSVDTNAEEREETLSPPSPIPATTTPMTTSMTTTSVVDNKELAKSLSDEAGRLAVAEEADKQLQRAREEAEAKERAAREAAAKRVQSQIEAEKLLAEKEAERQRVAWEEAERKRVQELHKKQADAEKKEVEEALAKAKAQQALLKAEEEVRAQAEAEARAEVEAEAERFRLDEKMRSDAKAETPKVMAEAEARKREKDEAAYSSNEMSSTRLKKTGSAVPVKPVNNTAGIKKKSARTMANLLDQMQASAEASGGTKDSAKRLDKAITIFAKTPISVLREAITAVNQDLLPAIGSDLDAHIRSGLEVYWLAYGDWNSMLTALENDLGPHAEQTSSWMRMAVSAGNELSENRLKELIKARGGTNAVPRAKRGSKKVAKTVYLAALIDLLRAENDNNYELVHKVLVLESDSATGGKKGFGA